jgi:hypothetical protein
MQIDFGTKKVWLLKKSKCSLDPRHKKYKEYQHADDAYITEMHLENLQKQRLLWKLHN